ncbi:MAG TPA: glycosyltransferase [Candidatus Binatia bacterium]|nr:glycosyltransferase [Candidatus Binatia bacterium]
MDAPSVSVIVPTYNRASYLLEAVRSILDQTYPDFEVIVVDDGSTDDTQMAMAGVRDPRLRYVRREHGGISAAMNTGVAASRGRFVARLDSDDAWLPDLLAVLVAELESDARLGFVYGRGRAMTAGGHLLAHTVGTPPRFAGRPLESLVYDDCTCNIAVVARRTALLEAGPYDETLTAAEDWDIWLRVARTHPFRFIDREVARFRRHDGNVTSLSSPALQAVLDCRLRVLDKLFERDDLSPSVMALRAAAYRNVYTFMTIRWLHAGRPRRAVRSFARSTAGNGNRMLVAARNAAFVLVYGYLTRWAAGRAISRVAAGLGRTLRARRLR